MNVNGLSCKEIDSMFSKLKTLAINDKESFKDELCIISSFFESEAIVNAGKNIECTIPNRLIVCSQNASYYISKGKIIESLGEIWDIIDYHSPDDALSVLDITIISVLLKSLYYKVKSSQ